MSFMRRSIGKKVLQILVASFVLLVLFYSKSEAKVLPENHFFYDRINFYEVINDVNGGVIESGDILEMSFFVENKSKSDYSDMILSNVLDTKLVFEEFLLKPKKVVSELDGNSIILNGISVKSGQKLELRISARVKNSRLPKGVKIKNQAELEVRKNISILSDGNFINDGIQESIVYFGEEIEAYRNVYFSQTLNVANSGLSNSMTDLVSIDGEYIIGLLLILAMLLFLMLLYLSSKKSLSLFLILALGTMSITNQVLAKADLSVYYKQAIEYRIDFHNHNRNPVDDFTIRAKMLKGTRIESSSSFLLVENEYGTKRFPVSVPMVQSKTNLEAKFHVLKPGIGGYILFRVVFNDDYNFKDKFVPIIRLMGPDFRITLPGISIEVDEIKNQGKTKSNKSKNKGKEEEVLTQEEKEIEAELAKVQPKIRKKAKVEKILTAEERVSFKYVAEKMRKDEVLKERIENMLIKDIQLVISQSDLSFNRKAVEAVLKRIQRDIIYEFLESDAFYTLSSNIGFLPSSELEEIVNDAALQMISIKLKKNSAIAQNPDHKKITENVAKLVLNDLIKLAKLILNEKFDSSPDVVISQQYCFSKAMIGSILLDEIDVAQNYIDSLVEIFPQYEMVILDYYDGEAELSFDEFTKLLVSVECALVPISYYYMIPGEYLEEISFVGEEDVVSEDSSVVEERKEVTKEEMVGDDELTEDAVEEEEVDDSSAIENLNEINLEETMESELDQEVSAESHESAISGDLNVHDLVVDDGGIEAEESQSDGGGAEVQEDENNEVIDEDVEEFESEAATEDAETNNAEGANLGMQNEEEIAEEIVEEVVDDEDSIEVKPSESNDNSIIEEAEEENNEEEILEDIEPTSGEEEVEAETQSESGESEEILEPEVDTVVPEDEVIEEEVVLEEEAIVEAVIEEEPAQEEVITEPEVIESI